jgi:hypothetical protein
MVRFDHAVTPYTLKWMSKLRTLASATSSRSQDLGVTCGILSHLRFRFVSDHSCGGDTCLE